MKNRKIASGELTLYIFCGLMALSGLTLIVLNIIAMNLPNLQNALRIANNEFAETLGMNWLMFGTLLMVLAAIIATITLSSYGAKEEQTEERKARRQQRLALEENTELE